MHMQPKDLLVWYQWKHRRELQKRTRAEKRTQRLHGSPSNGLGPCKDDNREIALSSKCRDTASRPPPTILLKLSSKRLPEKQPVTKAPT